jgi:hypothetical protein
MAGGKTAGVSFEIKVSSIKLFFYWRGGLTKSSVGFWRNPLNIGYHRQAAASGALRAPPKIVFSL